MRKIPDEQIKAIQAKADELRSLVEQADCRLIAYLDGCDWGFGLKVVPNEVEMGESGVDDETDSIDGGELQTTGLYGTVCNCEINSLFEEGECADPYKF